MLHTLNAAGHELQHASCAGASIDDSYFMEGLTIASIDDSSVRTHIFSAAVGIAYDTLCVQFAVL